jgi:MOSC domain-containing protein YiiM
VHVTAAVSHRTAEELAAFLPELDAVPRDEGTLELVVARPSPGVRQVLDQATLDRTVGLVGDSWAQRPSKRTPDQSPHPRMQVTVMSAPVIAFLAGDPDRRALAGDQLYVDLDLSHANLPVGARLIIGDPPTQGAVIEVTEEAHTGCAKFIERFGADAMRFVNGREGRAGRLRGLNAVVVTEGVIRPGDRVRVVRPDEC